jgi:hypothetical protein
MKRVFILVAALALTSCFATIAPKEIHQRQASYTSTGQDSGMLKDAAKPQGNGSVQTVGFAVNQEWIDGYDSLLAKYGDKLSPARKAFDRNGITKEGDHYRVSDAAMERKLVMNERRVNEQGP